MSKDTQPTEAELNKLPMELILKPGEKLESFVLSDEQIECGKKLMEKADAILEASKRIDYEKLAHTYITI